MSNGPVRNVVPLAYADSSLWPIPDISTLSQLEKAKFLAKKNAVEMYLADYSFKDIKARCKCTENEVRRLLRRCITSDGSGSIYGFRALLTGFRVKEYTRKSPVSHFASSDKGGCAGALSQLLEAHPDVAEELEDIFFLKAGAKQVQEARPSYAGVHRDFLKFLRKRGFSDYDWPFNTKHYGYTSIRNYCRELWERHAQYGMRSRAGEEAARRRGIGEGLPPLIPLLRAFSFTQLDFHKVDAASIIVFTNSYGEEIEVPVSRWHFGLLVEEKHKAVLGCYISLETTPSSDCVLETIESALIPESIESSDPKCALVSDGKIVINQLIPELAFQGFSALKMDNAWSNIGTEVVNQIIDTVGCAVNFGPVKSWWRRPLVERIFGELTRHGLQRLPSTFGSGSNDTRKSNPNEKAIKFRILISDLISIIFAQIRRHNDSVSEGLLGSSPVSSLQNALARPASGFFVTRLPIREQENMRLMTHVEVCTVRGNIRKNIRPYFKVDRCVHSNALLSTTVVD
jgi:putative transposase